MSKLVWAVSWALHVEEEPGVREAHRNSSCLENDKCHCIVRSSALDIGTMMFKSLHSWGAGAGDRAGAEVYTSSCSLGQRLCQRLLLQHSATRPGCLRILIQHPAKRPCLFCRSSCPVARGSASLPPETRPWSCTGPARLLPAPPAFSAAFACQGSLGGTGISAWLS